MPPIHYELNSTSSFFNIPENVKKIEKILDTSFYHKLTFGQITQIRQSNPAPVGANIRAPVPVGANLLTLAPAPLCFILPLPPDPGVIVSLVGSQSLLSV